MIMAFVCRGPHAILAAFAILAGLVWAGGVARAASLVVDVETGQIISSDAPNHLWYPASLTKVRSLQSWNAAVQAELAALINESFCLDAEGSPEKAAQLVGQALLLKNLASAEASENGKVLSHRLAVDLAHA